MLDTQLIHCCKKCLSFHNPTKGRTYIGHVNILTAGSNP